MYKSMQRSKHRFMRISVYASMRIYTTGFAATTSIGGLCFLTRRYAEPL